MKLSSKTSIIISAVSAIIWTALFVLFYLSEQNPGAYSEMDFGKVRGAQAQRFQLNKDEALIISKKGQNNYKNDVLLVSKLRNSEDIMLRIVRDQELLFEQRASKEYTRVQWNDIESRFEVYSADSEDVFWLKSGENGYNLIW